MFEVYRRATFSHTIATGEMDAKAGEIKACRASHRVAVCMKKFEMDMEGWMKDIAPRIRGVVVEIPRQLGQGWKEG